MSATAALEAKYKEHLFLFASDLWGTIVLDIGERLREERERLGLSQPALAEMCGVTMRSQRNYEKGERQPDAAYLAAITAAGADVLYILTGHRSFAPPPVLNRREQALLENYRGSDEEGKRLVEAASHRVAHPPAPRKSA